MEISSAAIEIFQNKKAPTIYNWGFKNKNPIYLLTKIETKFCADSPGIVVTTFKVVLSNCAILSVALSPWAFVTVRTVPLWV